MLGDPPESGPYHFLTLNLVKRTIGMAWVLIREYIQNSMYLPIYICKYIMSFVQDILSLVLYRRQLDLFQFLEDVSSLIQEAFSVLAH